jgi:hypothetical protein
VTGQAAWFDLRVKVEKAKPPKDGESKPNPGAQVSPVAKGPALLAWKLGK